MDEDWSYCRMYSSSSKMPQSVSFLHNLMILRMIAKIMMIIIGHNNINTTTTIMMLMRNMDRFSNLAFGA